MFERTIELFDEYYRRTDLGGAGLNKPAGVMVRRRLKQLDWLITSIQEREHESNELRERSGRRMMEKLAEMKAAGPGWEDVPASTTFISREEGRRSIDLGFEIELMSEAFYYLAESIRTLMKGSKGRKGQPAPPPPFPFLGDPGYVGVSRVRHHLLEHYTPDGRLVATGVSHGGERGPVLDSIRQQDITPPTEDAGLYVNARELATLLERKMTAAIPRLPPLNSEAHPETA